MRAERRKAAASNQPQRRLRLVTVPISWPLTDIWLPGQFSVSISSSLGNGPPPTRVV